MLWQFIPEHGACDTECQLQQPAICSILEWCRPQSSLAAVLCPIKWLVTTMSIIINIANVDDVLMHESETRVLRKRLSKIC